MKLNNFVVTSSGMSVLFQIKVNHHSHDGDIKLIAQDHSSLNTKALFKNKTGE